MQWISNKFFILAERFKIATIIAVILVHYLIPDETKSDRGISNSVVFYVLHGTKKYTVETLNFYKTWVSCRMKSFNFTILSQSTISGER